MWYTKSQNEIEKYFKTSISEGLDTEEAKIRLKNKGLNKLPDSKKKSLFLRFLAQFNDFMIIILISASVISAIISYTQNSGDYIDSIIIIAIVVFNAIMGLIQEEKAEKSLEALKQLTTPFAKVKRNSIWEDVPSTNIVPGDIVKLEAGNYVPADCRIISSSDLKIDESSLTGETIPVLKSSNNILSANTELGDITNMAFFSTTIVNGHGIAIVTDTGINTKVGKIADMIITDETPETPIQKKLSEVGKTLGIICLIICVVIFLVGLLKKIPAIEIFMTSVGLAVAAIPEGLPAIVTIVLSIGVTKMAKENSIIRKLPAVETLGSSSVICSDKTGTLTQNKMEVTNVFSLDDISVSNFSKTFNNEKNNTFNNEKNKLNILNTLCKTDKKAVELGCMCTDCEISIEDNTTTVSGEATESAIVNAAINIGISKNSLYSSHPRIADIPFDSKRKLMSTIHKDNDTYIVITKGAPDVLIQRCTTYFDGYSIENMEYSKKKLIEDANNTMAKNALRVIAIAYKKIPTIPSSITSNQIEDNLTFIGLLGMIDPPRPGVKEAIKTCKKAGIKTVMITGDHLLTASSIGKNLGILNSNDLAITGSELDNISQSQLEKNITKYSVFARVSPEHKVRIVKAFQSTGAVVAMTGDGVNDAPALKNADIGIAMGKNGTDVAKNAADMVLVDDNFITITKAVKQGRTIFENIQKAIHFLIATNIGEIVTIFLGLILGCKSTLLAIQLLWINLVTDSFPAIALGLEPPDPNIMNKKPRDSKKSIFSDGLWQKIILEGFMLGILTLFAFGIGNYLYNIETARTMAFVSLGLLELIHSFNIKSEQSIFKTDFTKNKFLIYSFLVGTVLQIGVVLVPPIAKVFSLVALNKIQWLYTLTISIMPIIIIEIQKKFNELKFGKIIYHEKFQ